jgi:hypothetical protein
VLLFAVGTVAGALGLVGLAVELYLLIFRDGGRH